MCRPIHAPLLPCALSLWVLDVATVMVYNLPGVVYSLIKLDVPFLHYEELSFHPLHQELCRSSRFISPTYRRVTIKAVLQDDPQALSRAVAARLDTLDIAVTTILNDGFLELPEGDAPVVLPDAAFQRHVGPYLRKELNDAPFCRVLPCSRSAGTA